MKKVIAMLEEAETKHDVRCEIMPIMRAKQGVEFKHAWASEVERVGPKLAHTLVRRGGGGIDASELPNELLNAVED